jgi:asparagine synthase (glutamine-hydrolysing)
VSRIAGICCSESGAPLADWLGLMAAGIRTVGQPRTAETGEAIVASLGGNPQICAENGIVAVVDGALYNPEELDGAPENGFAAQLVATYRAGGFTQALARINGDFAAALYDADTKTLWLGRDRVGARPLYYAADAQHIAFASQPQMLRALPWVDGRVNDGWAAVFAGSHYRYIDNRPDESPFRAIKQVPAATALRVQAGRVESQHYWQLVETAEWEANEAELAERYRELLLDAVRRRLQGSARPAFTLSGGMDSSSVLACATEIMQQKQFAFSSVYTDKTYDESEAIAGFVAEKVARWQPVRIEGFDLFDVVRRMVRAHGEPVATATWLSHFLLCEEVAGQSFDVLFGGLGGDELNAGEYEYFVCHFADLKHQGRAVELEHEIAEWARHHDHPIYRKNLETAARMLRDLTDPTSPGRVRVDRQRFTRYAASVRRDYFELEEFIPALDHPFSGWLKNRAYQDIFRETTPCCLRAEDRNCEVFGLGHADPFLDHRLLDFMFRVPGSSKIRDGITKRLLREAMRGILPEETRTRIAKTGWNAPAHLWFGGRTLDDLSDLVHSRAFLERGIYDVPAVLRLVEEHRAIVAATEPRENHMMFLWQLLNLELWFREVVDQRAPVAPSQLETRRA